jgi:Cof subfamily protein (haloacid dehalogenase superfamily)
MYGTYIREERNMTTMLVDQIRLMCPSTAVLDLDGTLLSPEGKLTESSCHALQLLHDHDIGIIIATARSWFEIQPFWNDLLTDYPIICMDGALIYDPQNNHVLYSESLDVSAIDAVRNIVDGIAHIVVETATCLWSPNATAAMMMALAFGIRRKVINIGYPTGEVILRLYLASQQNHNGLDRDFEIKISSILGTRYNIFRPGTHWLLISSSSASKSKALAWLCGQYGLLPKHIIAFGDGINDMELFKLAGLSVAPSNATDSIKQCATIITKHSNGAGVEELVSEWIEAITTNL